MDVPFKNTLDRFSPEMLLASQYHLEDHETLSAYSTIKYKEYTRGFVN
jgi:hypothetical protein